MAVILKNTFIDVVPLDEPLERTHSRRCTSVPPAWKPFRCSNAHCLDDARVAPSDACADAITDASTDASTQDSDNESEMTVTRTLNDAEDMDIAQYGEADDLHINRDRAVQAVELSVGDAPPTCDKVQLCLDVCVTKTKTRLSPKTRTFTPQTQPCVPEEMQGLIQNLQMLLYGLPDVVTVEVSQCALGATTTIVAQVPGNSLGAALIPETLNSAKATMSNISAESSGLYILGYCVQPFQDIVCGFKATIGCVSAELENTVCWDIYEKGCCPRRNTCRWHHPLATDLMQVVVKIQEF